MCRGIVSYLLPHFNYISQGQGHSHHKLRLSFTYILITVIIMSSQDPTSSELHSDQFDGYEFDSNITVTSSQASGSTSSRKRPRTSFVWDYMPAHRTTAYFNAENALIWRCKHCTKVYRESGGTT